jgi:ribosomal protein L29
MEYKELKKKQVSDLHKLLNESREKLRDLRFKDANKQLKDVRELRMTRRMIAQIHTLLKAGNAQKETGSEKVETKKE